MTEIATNITIVQMFGIFLISLGSYVARRMGKEARPNIHRFLLMTKLSYEEFIIYLLVIFFAEVLYIVMLIEFFQWYAVIAMVVLFHFAEDYVWGGVEEKLPLKYMYRMSQVSSVLGAICVIM